MKKKYFFFCLLNMCLLFSENIGDDIVIDVKEEINYIDDGSYFVIKSDTELFQKKILALQGDSIAADDLTSHYMFVQNMDCELQILNINYWIEILIENDITPRSQYNYYAISKCYNLDNSKRGLFWLYTSGESNYKTAVMSVKIIENNQRIFTIANNNDYLIKELKKEQLVPYKDASLRGSGTAAYSLGKYYEQMNRKGEFSYWYRIGAQNSNEACMLKYGKILKNSKNEFDKLRSKFWIKRAARNGNEEAKKLLKEMV